MNDIPSAACPTQETHAAAAVVDADLQCHRCRHRAVRQAGATLLLWSISDLETLKYIYIYIYIYIFKTLFHYLCLTLLALWTWKWTWISDLETLKYTYIYI